MISTTKGLQARKEWGKKMQGTLWTETPRVLCERTGSLLKRHRHRAHSKGPSNVKLLLCPTGPGCMATNWAFISKFWRNHTRQQKLILRWNNFYQASWQNFKANTGLTLGPWRCLILLPGESRTGRRCCLWRTGKLWKLWRHWLRIIRQKVRAVEGPARWRGGAGLQVYCECLVITAEERGDFLFTRHGGAALAAPWEPQFLIASFSFSRFAFSQDWLASRKGGKVQNTGELGLRLFKVSQKCP